MHFLPAIKQMTNKYIFADIQLPIQEGKLTTFQFSPYNELIISVSSHDDVDGWMPVRYALQASPQFLPVFLKIDAHITQD